MNDILWDVSFMVFALVAVTTYFIVVILKLEDDSQSH